MTVKGLPLIKSFIEKFKTALCRPLRHRFKIIFLFSAGILCFGSSFNLNLEEVYYNALIFERTGKLLLSVVCVFLAISIVRLIFKSRFTGLFFISRKIFQWAVWLGFLVFTIGLGIRWVLAGHAPLSNQYESMVFAAWASLLAGIALSRHSRLPMMCGSFLSGIVLLMAHRPSIDAAISPLPPVLKSPLMITHVSIAIAGYGFFAVGTALSFCNLLTMAFPISGKKNKLLTRVSTWSKITEQALWTGLFLISIGCILGAIWANETWGRYWGWDPKESWTLILILSYTLVLNLRLVIRFHWTYWLNVWACFAFGSLLMTYFGVNQFFSGMHTYGGEGGNSFLFMVISIPAMWILLSLLAYRNRNRV
jgi:cytochrome c-type biogenesis protein CcsB